MELVFKGAMENEERKLLFGIGTDNFISLLVFGLIFTLGVLGNSVVITVLARSKPGKPRGTTNIFILNLSIADLSYLLFCIPFQSTVYILPSWVLGAFICKFIHYFFTVSMLVSIFTLSAMSVDRYIAIVHSRKSSSIRVAKYALIGVVVIWIISLVMAAPIMHYQNIFHSSDNYTFCWEVWPDQTQKKIYVVCTFVFGYVLPLLLISFCYAKVLNHLHKKLRNMSKKSEASKKKVGVIYFFRCHFGSVCSNFYFFYIDSTEHDGLMLPVELMSYDCVITESHLREGKDLFQ
uniref:G-protein coupled receptors family 1 profile domain-containing protein n=1 Tax=Oryzias sinensis TaxID=183150 RepID=A0A8C7WU85_9TELE